MTRILASHSIGRPMLFAELYHRNNYYFNPFTDIYFEMFHIAGAIPPERNELLQENGFKLLQENGGSILLE